jgi:glycosyltransferase involved in cell wall biosynthesis
VTDSSDERLQPLTILLGCDTFAPDVNGAARFAERLAAGLVERGHTVHVIAPATSVFRTGEWEETHEGARLKMHRLFSLRWYPQEWLRFMMPWTMRRNAGRILDEIKPDAVHFQSHFVVGRGLSLAARSRGIRVIATNHTMPENMVEHTTVPKPLQPVLLRWAWRDATQILKRADAVTTPTRRAADYLEEATGITGVHAIGNGVRVSDYTPDFEHRGNCIVFVGRVASEKRLEVLVRAVALLPKGLDWSLEIVGDGEQRHQLERLAAQLQVDDRVRFAGAVSDAELKDAYTRSDVLAMPSTAELQSLVTMEAMSSGLPVVAADAMALPHLVHDGENGYLFRPDDPHDLARKLERILTLPDEEFRRMKKASLRLIRAHDIERTLTTFECLYRGKPVVDPVTDLDADDESHGDTVTEGR